MLKLLLLLFNAAETLLIVMVTFFVTMQEAVVKYVSQGFENDFAHFSRAFAHQARVTILLEMIKSNGIVEGRVVEVPGMSPSTVIQHLREMKKSGIIDGRIFGMRSKYWIVGDWLLSFEKVSQYFFETFRQLTVPQNS
jgi:hypothetical protein